MATYQELVDLSSSTDWGVLVNRVAVACAVKAHAVAQEATPSAAAQTWAREALQDPRSKADTLIFYLVAANKDLTVSQLTGASDTALQNAVDDAVDSLFGV